ncbi:MAG: type II toxin-antitoxin system VapC family toxin [Acidobacteriota bacterium]
MSLMLIDSNIIIYSVQPEHSNLRNFIAQNAPAVSAISYVEVVGYHKLTEQDRQFFEAFFSTAQVLSISKDVVEEAARLRQMKKLSLGDALIAATALKHQLTLVTRNVVDFAWIANLRLLNPFDSENQNS